MTDEPILTQLGHTVVTPMSPEDATLECVANPHPGTNYVTRYTCPEFTCVCPVTGQPDFAHLVIDYVPGERLVESKSLKLYLWSYRNHAGFHEGTTIDIAKKFIDVAAVVWIRIAGYWYPRGGIPIDVFWQSGAPPKDTWLPDTGVPSYRGRG